MEEHPDFGHQHGRGVCCCLRRVQEAAPVIEATGRGICDLYITSSWNVLTSDWSVVGLIGISCPVIALQKNSAAKLCQPNGADILCLVIGLQQSGADIIVSCDWTTAEWS